MTQSNPNPDSIDPRRLASRAATIALATLALATATGCGAGNVADVERFEAEGTNEFSPAAWSSDEVVLSATDRVVVWRRGEPSVSVELETCGQSFNSSATIELGVEDETGCTPRVVYSEFIHECEDCRGLGGALVGGALHGIFGPEHRWGSDLGTAELVRDEELGITTIAIEAEMNPTSISFGENTAEGRFRLRSDIELSELSVDD